MQLNRDDIHICVNSKSIRCKMQNHNMFGIFSATAFEKSQLAHNLEQCDDPPYHHCCRRCIPLHRKHTKIVCKCRARTNRDAHALLLAGNRTLESYSYLELLLLSHHRHHQRASSADCIDKRHTNRMRCCWERRERCCTLPPLLSQRPPPVSDQICD